MVLPCGGMGKWAFSGNKGVNREGEFVGFCLYVCVSGVFSGVNAVLN